MGLDAIFSCARLFSNPSRVSLFGGTLLQPFSGLPLWGHSSPTLLGSPSLGALFSNPSQVSLFGGTLLQTFSDLPLWGHSSPTLLGSLSLGALFSNPSRVSLFGGTENRAQVHRAQRTEHRFT